jgi:hypothetical protein
VNARSLRRSKPSLVLRVRALWLIGALVLGVAGALALALANAPQLRVRAVDANVPAGGPVTQSAVIAAARIEPDANLWLLDTGAIRRRIEAIPYVATAEVHRAQFPQPSVSLTVTLRQPADCVRFSDGTVTIDATVRVLETGCVSSALPIVEVAVRSAVAPGATVDDSVVGRLLADAKVIGDHIPLRSIRLDRFGGVEAVDTSGVILRFGSDADLAAKVVLVEPVRRAAQGRPLRAIDLRAPGTPVIEFP